MSATEITEEINNLKTILSEKRRNLKNIKRRKENPKKRGRKPGTTGIKCTKLKYNVSRIRGQDLEDEDMGNFCTIQDIANEFNFSYSIVYKAFKDNKRLNDSLIITKLP